MKILGVSSVTRDCGVAIVENGVSTGHLSLAEGRGLSESLIPAIYTLLERTGSTIETLDAIAVTAGPGSFTGIKVGLAAVKGFALALPVRAVGISTLEALAWSVGPREYPLYTVINAGRGEVFAGCYFHDGNSPEQRMPDGLFEPEKVAAMISGPALLVGDAAPAIENLIRSNQQKTESVLTLDNCEIPLAVAIAQAGSARVSRGIFDAAASLAPLYLRRAEAEVQLEKKLSSSANPA